MKGSDTMPRRGENIYKRKDGRWEGRILKDDGKYTYVYAKTYKEVRQKKKNLQKNVRFSEIDTLNPEKSTSELFKEWLTGDLSEHVKPSTYENYYICIQKYVIPFFELTDSNRITEFQISQFVKTIYKNSSISESYKKKILSIFKTALKGILKDYDNCISIVNAVKLPKNGNSVVQVFSMKEQRLVENAVLHSTDKRMLGILLCFYTGIRLGELCALRWDDIDFEAGTMSIVRTVSRTKTFQQNGPKTNLLIGIPKSEKSVRKIPLPYFLLKLSSALKTHIKAENCYVISDSDIPIDPRTYQKLFKQILKNADVKDRKFHAIRHTFATRALELGVDIKTLSEILGHSNVSITLNVYTHSLMEQKKIAVNKLNEMHMSYMENPPFSVSKSVISF